MREAGFNRAEVVQGYLRMDQFFILNAVIILLDASGAGLLLRSS